MLQKEVSNNYVQNYSKRYYERLDEFEAFIKKINLDIKNKKILDLACGPGQYEVIFDKYKPKLIVCQDKYKKYIQEAKKKHKEYALKSPIKYVVNDMMDLKYPKDEFDLVFCHGAFFYAKNEPEIIQRLSKIIKKGGMLYIRTDNINTLKKIKWYNPLRYISYVFYSINLYAFEEKIFPVAAQSPKKLSKLFKKYGFSVERVIMEKYNFQMYLKKK